MLTKTLSKIKDVEQQAEAIIKQARNAAILEAKHTREQQEQELAGLRQRLNQERQQQVKQAETEARAEAGKIESSAKDLVNQLNNEVAPNLAQAKKEILRCLS